MSNFIFYHLVGFFIGAGIIAAHILFNVIAARTSSPIWGEVFTDYKAPMIVVYIGSLVFAWVKYDE